MCYVCGVKERRKDIESLRGIAVLSVFAYHLNPEWLPNGLLGVDIFFVISGYVITGSLDSRKGPFLDNLLEFYVRRAKRLLPALVFCITTFSALAFYLTPDHLGSLTTGIYALFGISNFYLYFNSVEYFAGLTELNTFTHTWSLGVEEQYYLLYPALFLSLTRRLVPLLIGMSIVSAWIFFTADKLFSFYMLPARFWELGLGCLVYLIVARRPNQGLWLASIAVLFASLFIPMDTRIATGMAVLAAATVIATHKNGLTNSVMVFIGTISYSLYLWHWPVIVIARHTVGLDQSLYLPIIALTFGLACFSYFIVEMPLRYGQWGSLLKSFGYAATSVFIAVGFLLLLSHSVWRHTVNDRVYSASGRGFHISGIECHLPQTENPISDCLTPRQEKTVFVIGDSHARSLIPAVHEAFSDRGLRYLTDRALVFDMLGIDACGGSPCVDDEIGARIEFLNSLARPGDVVVFSISRDVVGKHIQNLHKNLERLIAELDGLRVILVDDVPKVCTTRSDFILSLSDPQTCKISAEQSLAGRASLSSVYKAIASRHPISLLDPHDLLCQSGYCSNYLNGEIIYADESPHLTLKASLNLAPMFDGVAD